MWSGQCHLPSGLLIDTDERSAEQKTRRELEEGCCSMMLYHGGAEEIVSPDLMHSRKAVDFGAGFYVTPIFDQACWH